MNADAHARYDFRRSDRISGDQIRAIRAVHESFARGLSSSLSACLRTQVGLSLSSLEQTPCKAFLAGLSSPTCLSLLRTHPQGGIALLALSPDLAFPLVELLLGGGRIRPTVVRREVTAIEQQVLAGLLELILQDLSAAWRSVVSVRFRIEAHETDPGLVKVLPPEEPMLSVTAEVALLETSGVMQIAVPSSLLTEVSRNPEQQRSRDQRTATEEEMERVLRLAGEAAVSIEARVEGSVVRFDDLLQLNPGDILQFDQRTSQPVSLLINGLPRWRGAIRIENGRKAVALDQPV